MVYLLSIFGLNMLKQKSNTYICTTSFKPTSPNLASQTINPFTEPSVYTSIHEKNITIYNYIYISIHWTIRLFTHPSIEPPISQTTSYSLVLSSYINPQTHDIIIKTFKPRIRYINPKLEPHPPQKNIV